MADVSRSTAVLIVLICVLGAANAQIVGRPLVRMRKAMEQLAAGDANTSIPHLARRDEVGAMARAVEVFKDGMHEREHLRAERSRRRHGR